MGILSSENGKTKSTEVAFGKVADEIIADIDKFRNMNDKTLIVDTNLRTNNVHLNVKINKLVSYMIVELFGKTGMAEGLRTLVVNEFLAKKKDINIPNGLIKNSNVSSDISKTNILPLDSKEITELKKAFKQFYYLFMAINLKLNEQKSIGGEEVNALLWDEFTSLAKLIDLEAIDKLKVTLIGSDDEKIQLLVKEELAK